MNATEEPALPSADQMRQAIAGVFDRSSETYDAVGVAFFTTFAHQLLADIKLAPGERVLDVGCGRGATLFPAAERVGDNGSVFGIDLSPAMIERTAADIRDQGLTNVSLAVMDAERPTLTDPTFDVVVAAFVAFFLPDPIAGLRAWHDLLVPGGRIGLATFGEDDHRWGRIREVFRPFVPPAMVRAAFNPASPFASTENLERTLASVGFTGVSSVMRQHLISYADPEQWIAWSWSHGQRMYWELVPEDRRQEVRNGVLAALEPLREADGGLVMVQNVRYTVAGRG
jgi:ubiquinone/menaquinone biosynthesis C-methylase UbiE